MARKEPPAGRLALLFGALPREVRHSLDRAKKELQAAGFRNPDDLCAPPRKGGDYGVCVQAGRGLAEQDAYMNWVDRRERLSPETWNLLKKLMRLPEPGHTAGMCLVGLVPVRDFPKAHVKASAILEKAFPRERAPGRGWCKCEEKAPAGW